VTNVRRTLSDAARHQAQLVGVASAYSFDEPAFRRTLKATVPHLEPVEDVLAGYLCFRGWRPRLGILFVTSDALLWVKQTFVRRKARAVRIPFCSLRRVRASTAGGSRLQLHTYQAASDEGDEEAGEWFSAEQMNADSFFATCRVLQRLLRDRFEMASSPEQTK
jgi:hypothetical protein